MPDHFRLFASSAAIIALGLGLLIKAERYGPAKKPDFTTAKAHIGAGLQTMAWHRIPPSPGDIKTAYQTLTFRHPTCPMDLNVLVLGYTGDLLPLLRTRFSNDLTLIQNGSRVEAFDTRTLQIENLWTALGRSIGLTAAPVPPLIALTPALETLARTCPKTPLPAPQRLFTPPTTS